MAVNNVDLPNGWKLGSLLGTGAQGSVYSVLDKDRKTTEWAVKITKAPISKTGKKEANVRANASSLRNESHLYNAHLLTLRGSMVPEVPRGCSGVRESNGFLYLVMERMDCDLFGKLSQMARQKSPNIAVGPLAGRMVELIESIHKKRQLVIDIKPENFMFAMPGTTVGLDKKKKKKAGLEGDLRAVDFGWMRAFQRSEPVPELQGNAMYASLHMHTLSTASRRDDLEMLCYVVGEILIRLQAMVQGTTKQYEQTAIPSYLPWSQETSDEDVHQAKRTHVLDKKSEFYSRMPKPAAAKLFECLELLWSYSFNDEPDYAAITKLLSTLSVPNNPKADRKPAATARTASTKRRAANHASPATSSAAAPVIDLVDSEDDETGESPTKFRVLRSGRKMPSPSSPVARGAAKHSEDSKPPASGRRKRCVASQDDSMEVDEEFHCDREDDNNVEDVSMTDVENLPNGNVDRADGVVLVNLLVEIPEEEDETIPMTSNTTVILGSKLKSRKSKNNDFAVEVPGIGAVHAQFKLKVQRGRAVAVLIKDLKSPQNTSVVGKISNKPVKKGGEGICLIPGTILLGDSGVAVHVSRA